MKRFLNIRVAHAILAGLQLATAGTLLADVLGAKPAALIALAVGGLQVAVASYQLQPTTATNTNTKDAQ